MVTPTVRSLAPLGMTPQGNLVLGVFAHDRNILAIVILNGVKDPTPAD